MDKTDFENDLVGIRGATASEKRSRDEGLAALIRGAGDAADEVVPPERRPTGVFEMGSTKAESRVPSLITMPLVWSLVAGGLFISLLTEQTALTALCILVFAAVIGAKAWSRVALIRVGNSIRVDKKKLFPSETTALTIEVENNKLLPVWLRVKVALEGPRERNSLATYLEKDSGLLSYQRVYLSWQMSQLQRGVHRFGPVELEAGDLLGFFRRKKKLLKSPISWFTPVWFR